MAPLNEDVALRIALAARALPEVEVKTLLLGIMGLLGNDLTVAKLNKLRLLKLKQLEFLSEIDETYLKEALGYLKGKNINAEAEPLPEIVPLSDGEMPSSIRVACSSNNGNKIDGHFGSCARYLIYQVSADEIRLIDIRPSPKVDDGEEKNEIRADLISDCQILYTMSIGGPAAAKVVKKGLHPIKFPQGASAETIISKLQVTLGSTPPPWLAKAMGVAAEDRVKKFDEEEAMA